MASSTQFRIIIVGGGIAGLSAAVALRAPSRQITVLEQSQFVGEIGANISLQPNASRIVHEEWRVDTISGARGMADRGFRILNTEGKEMRFVPLDNKPEYGGERIMYHRQDLHSCLKRAAIDNQRGGDAVMIKTSAKVVVCDPDQGIVTLCNGEQLEADLIVAADGIHSVLRDMVVGERVTPNPTGLSAYRMSFPTAELEEMVPEFCETIKVREPITSMMVAFDCRLIMGPARDGHLYGIVALVPDDRMHEDADAKQSWNCEGDINKLLETFREFPDWVKEVFRVAKDIGLWQLRDIDPLPTWTRGRVILIGDAAHAMLPTQGQGACQAVEDAEALAAFLKDVEHKPSFEDIQSRLYDVFEARHERATFIQKYSRQAIKPHTDPNNKSATL